MPFCNITFNSFTLQAVVDRITWTLEAIMPCSVGLPRYGLFDIEMLIVLIKFEKNILISLAHIWSYSFVRFIDIKYIYNVRRFYSLLQFIFKLTSDKF